MKPEQILSLLGKKSTAKEVEALFKAFNIKRRPELDEDDVENEEICAWIPVRKLGIEFGFEDEGHFKALDRPLGNGPLLFTQVIFYNEREDILPWQGELPHSLSFQDSRTDTQRKLQHYNHLRRSYIRDVWDLPEYRLIVDYDKEKHTIGSAICQLPRRPSLKRKEPSPQPPTIDELTKLIGVAPDSKVFLSTFASFQIKDYQDELRDNWEADLRYEYGIEILFDKYFGKSKKKIGLTTFIFYADRAFDARGWEGELPLALSFDDDQNTLFKKMGVKPFIHADDFTTGYAVWKHEKFIIKVIYSNMENRIFQISMLAPGYTKPFED